MWFEIPLSGDSEQFTVSILGTMYTLRVIYRGTPYDMWVLDVLDQNGVELVTGIPLVTGCDLLEPFSSTLGTAFSLFVSTDGSPDSVPTEDNLGNLSHLYVRS